MYYVYVLKSETDEGFYIGYSSDLKTRVNQHFLGKVEATKYRRPIRLVYYESYLAEDLARERERRLKDFGSAYNALLKRLKYK